MSDSPDLRSVITEQMNDDEHVTNQETKTKPEVKKAPPTEQPQETEVESFSQKIDTSGMTQKQIDEVYSKYQKAYTQKRQKEKEEIRKYQEQIKAYEERMRFQPPQAPSNTEQKEVQRQFDLGNLSFEQYTQAMRQASQEDARRIAEEVWSQKQDSTNQEQMLQRFNSLDERFDKRFTDAESPEYNPTNAWLYKNVAMELGNALDAHIKQTGSSIGFDSDTIAKEAIKHFDGLIDAIVASKVKESTQNAQNRAVEVSRTTPKGGSAKSNVVGSRNLRELISSKMGD